MMRGNKAAIDQLKTALGPYVSKYVLRSNRPPYMDWRLDRNNMPPTIPFTPATLGGLSPPTPIFMGDNTAPFDLRRPYRVLSLDGGGVRGIMITTMLERIVKKQPDFMQNVDFVCGTSVGGLIALMLATGYSPKECTEIFKWAIPNIFGHFPFRRINPFVSKYDDIPKQEILQEFLGDRTMVDLKKACAVVAFRFDGRRSRTHSFFNREGWRPAIYSNMAKAEGLVEPDYDLKAWDAGMRTSAAPTYFPVYNGCVDGGIVANNPSVVAVSKLMAHFPHATSRNVTVLSVGAGSFPQHAELKLEGRRGVTRTDTEISAFGGKGWKADWGLAQWSKYLLDILLEGDSVLTEMVMHYMLSKTELYHRIDPRLPSQIPLDDVDAIAKLIDLGEHVDMTDTFRFVEDNFAKMDLTSYDHTMVTNSLDNATSYHDAWMDNQTYIYKNVE